MAEYQPIEKGDDLILDPLEEEAVSFYEDLENALINLPEYQESVRQTKVGMIKAGYPALQIWAMNPTIRFSRGYADYSVYYGLKRPSNRISIARFSRDREMKDGWIEASHIPNARDFRGNVYPRGFASLSYNYPMQDGSMGSEPGSYDLRLVLDLCKKFLGELKNPHVADVDLQ